MEVKKEVSRELYPGHYCLVKDSDKSFKRVKILEDQGHRFLVEEVDSGKIRFVSKLMCYVASPSILAIRKTIFKCHLDGCSTKEMAQGPLEYRFRQMDTRFAQKERLIAKIIGYDVSRQSFVVKLSIKKSYGLQPLEKSLSHLLIRCDKNAALKHVQKMFTVQKLNKSMKMMINYFPLTNSTPFRVKQYDVRIEDKDRGLGVTNPNGENVLSSLKQRIIIKKAILKMANDLEKEFKYRTVYNGGRVVYSLSDFATGRDECSILVSEKYLVIFKKTNEIDMEQDITLIRNMIGKSVALRPQMAIIDIVLKFALTNLLINFGRSFFPLNDPPSSTRFGIFASAVIAFDAIALNVDVANAVIAPEISLLDFLRKKGISEDDLTASKTNPQLLQSISEFSKDRTKIIVKYDSEGKHKRYATFNSFKMESPFEYKFVLNNDDS
ncbi:hypothetical protein ACOME3_006343 [Neoechinorhynchus agilis]